MTNQLNISQTHQLNWTKLWLFCKIFLVCLIAVTLLSSVVNFTFNIYIFNLCILSVFLVFLLILKFKKKQHYFIKIEDKQLIYFCPVKKVTVSIPTADILRVTTQFCELQIHTSMHTHCLNLNNIKEESVRWEIKEMIKKLACDNSNRAVNF